MFIYISVSMDIYIGHEDGDVAVCDETHAFLVVEGRQLQNGQLPSSGILLAICKRQWHSGPGNSA
jgi:hypothetical protein